jgi:hypothetical protein
VSSYSIAPRLALLFGAVLAALPPLVAGSASADLRWLAVGVVLALVALSAARFVTRTDESLAPAAIGDAAALGALALGVPSGAVVALFVVAIVVHFLPASWSDHISKWLPANAGGVITSVRPEPGNLGPWMGLFVFFLYPAVLLVLAGVSLVRRDA